VTAATSTRPGPPARYGVVVPVKRLAAAKSRLASLGDDVRRELVGAFVTDTVSALLDTSCVGRVLVVTDEVALATWLTGLGVAAIPDARSDDLNATLVQGVAELLRRDPDLRPAAVCADLPALRPEELSGVLATVEPDRAAFVADAAGVGTTFYTAPDLETFEPRFGSRSREAHLAAGAVELDTTAAPSLARDVDTPDDLRAALELGVGNRTSFVLTTVGLDRR
jgi:2-phospho-L-lactate/phosphoenolpyruvate guanylyltransferase